MQVESPHAVRSVLFRILGRMLAAWTGIELEASEIYGIRRYHNGSWLMMHTDRIETHVVSAILQVRSHATCFIFDAANESLFYLICL